MRIDELELPKFPKKVDNTVTALTVQDAKIKKTYDLKKFCKNNNLNCKVCGL